VIRLEPLELAPGDAPRLDLEYRLSAVGGVIPAQTARFSVRWGDAEATAAEYMRDVAPARTFSTLEEAQGARKMGLFGHLTPREMLVIGPSGPVENTLRFENEPARHKLLDLIGDLSLCGRPINGRVIAERSGHALNHEAARVLAGW
jgi:UDP-3-O-acyl-N-acetylglucosamine deacetylase